MHSGISFALMAGLLFLSTVSTDKALPPELEGEAGFNKVRETYAKAMIMFYAPWCPHCQDAKPKYNEAMGKLTDKTTTMAYVNCDNAKNSALCTKEKIEGFPTIKVYQKGKDAVNFEADFTPDGFVSFLNNPVADSPQAKEQPTPDPPMTDVTYIKGASDFKLKVSPIAHALIFFYAPWCPHCQEAKPKYSKVGTELKKAGEKDRVLFAVNCDLPENNGFCTSEKVEGFPTVRYYHKGELFQEVEEELETEPLLNIIRNPPKVKVPPTPVEEEKTPGAKPAATPGVATPGKPGDKLDGEKPLTDADRQPEKPEDLMKGITYITGATAKDVMEKNPDTLVKFYAPWCPHCIEAKPIYQAANEDLKKAGSGVLLAAINCDAKESEKWCEDQKVDGFPTLAYYHKGKKVKVYEESPPTHKGIVAFMSNPPRPKEEL